jgi:hypothetical protein
MVDISIDFLDYHHRLDFVAKRIRKAPFSRCEQRLLQKHLSDLSACIVRRIAGRPSFTWIKSSLWRGICHSRDIQPLLRCLKRGRLTANEQYWLAELLDPTLKDTPVKIVLHNGKKRSSPAKRLKRNRIGYAILQAVDDNPSAKVAGIVEQLSEEHRVGVSKAWKAYMEAKKLYEQKPP